MAFVAAILSNSFDYPLAHYNNDTPLHTAVSCNNIDILKLLLSGYNVGRFFKFNSQGQTPLQQAIAEGKIELADTILTYFPEELLKLYDKNDVNLKDYIAKRDFIVAIGSPSDKRVSELLSRYHEDHPLWDEHSKELLENILKHRTERHEDTVMCILKTLKNHLNPEGDMIAPYFSIPCFSTEFAEQFPELIAAYMPSVSKPHLEISDPLKIMLEQTIALLNDYLSGYSLRDKIVQKWHDVFLYHKAATLDLQYAYTIIEVNKLQDAMERAPVIDWLSINPGTRLHSMSVKDFMNKIRQRRINQDEKLY